MHFYTYLSSIICDNYFDMAGCIHRIDGRKCGLPRYKSSSGMSVALSLEHKSEAAKFQNTVKINYIEYLTNAGMSYRIFWLRFQWAHLEVQRIAAYNAK